MNEQILELLKDKINAVDARVGRLENSVNEVGSDVKEMLKFKWQIIGGSVVISAVVGVAIQILITIMGR